jgi:hypothetical protein
MFSRADLIQFRKKGIPKQEVERQLACFRNGFPAMPIVAAATVGNGIHKLEESELADLRSVFERKLKDKRVLKFVPASGAATRMFKELFEFRDRMKAGEKAEDLLSDRKMAPVASFFANIRRFAFFDALQRVSAARGMGMETLLAQKEYHTILDLLLEKEGLGYGFQPKGLLLFHNYPDGPLTAVEEHMVEGALYARNRNGKVRIHFTVSPEHKAEFKRRVALGAKRISRELKVRFDVTYSEQFPSTDTIAVDLENNPFREKDGSILFRPGGHGALLANLNRINADCIFIKNIDNVCHRRFLETTVQYKAALAGKLFSLQDRIFQFLRKLENSYTTDLLSDIITFYNKELSTQMPKEFSQWTQEKKRDYLRKKLDRPVRVCGMVRSDGDTGGGPFHAVNPDGSISLQVVETAQINLKDSHDRKIFESSTHFSPADFALGVRNYAGKKFDLMRYRDPRTGFIAVKSKGGRELKALELPGLWNGSMSDWNTAFIEVPSITFNPVKSVVDLLKDSHNG